MAAGACGPWRAPPRFPAPTSLLDPLPQCLPLPDPQEYHFLCLEPPTPAPHQVLLCLPHLIALFGVKDALSDPGPRPPLCAWWQHKNTRGPVPLNPWQMFVN